MNWIKKHHRILVAAALFAACLFVFAVFWQLSVRGASQKSRSAYLNDTQDATTAAVTTTIEQTFLCDTSFHALGLLPTYRNEVLFGNLYLTIYDGSGNQLAPTVEGNAAETHSGSYAVFTLAHPVQSANGVYRLVFETVLKNPDTDFALIKSGESLAGWELLENGKPAPGSLCLLAAVDAIGNFANIFYLIFAVLASGLLACISYVATGKARSLASLIALCAAGLGLLYCFILPPYAAPSEELYINRAFNLSTRALAQWDGPISPGTVVRRAADQDVAIQQSGTTIFTYRELARGSLARTGDDTATAFTGESSTGGILFHLPATLGVLLARVMGLGLVPTLYLGRLFSLTAYVLLLAAAIKIIPTGKCLFAAFALLPLSVNLAASYNITGLALASTSLFLALWLAAMQQRSIALPRFLLVSVLGLALCSAGLWYLPVALLLLPLSGTTLTHRGRALPRPAALGATASSVLLCAVIAVTGYWGQRTLTCATEAPLFPVENFVKTLLGGTLGDGNIALNWGLTLAVSLLLAFALLPAPQEPALSKNTRRLLGVAAAVILAANLILSGYGSLAAVRAAASLPLFLFALYRPWGGLTKKQSFSPFLFTAFSATAIFSLLDAFLIILTR